MEAWETAVKEFVATWENDPQIIAGVLTGSYVTGNQDASSDIDIYLVSADSRPYRERGNRIVHGFLMEYFINPAWKIHELMDPEQDSLNRVTCSLLVNGKVLFDRTRVLPGLKERAREILETPLEALGDSARENYKYHIFAAYTELDRAFRAETPDFGLCYHLLLNRLIDSYADFLQTLLPTRYKLYRFLTESGFAERYGLRPFPDATFSALFLECLEQQEKHAAFRCITALKDHVLDAMGGFHIDGWVQRTPVPADKS
jgi:predicted nucleotidyltransferase